MDGGRTGLKGRIHRAGPSPLLRLQPQRYSFAGTLHKNTCLSSAPEASHLPSGLNASDWTRPVCPRRVDFSTARDIPQFDLGQVRSSITESGTLEVGGASVCGFMTSWGDGFFPVVRDLDANGRLVRIRIEVGCDEIVARQQRLDEWWWGAFAKQAAVSEQVFQDGQCIRFLYREEPYDDQDSGWRVFTGEEEAEFCENLDNYRDCPLRDLIERDRSLGALFRSPVGSAFERATCGEDFHAVEGFKTTR